MDLKMIKNEYLIHSKTVFKVIKTICKEIFIITSRYYKKLQKYNQTAKLKKKKNKKKAFF